MCVCVGGGLQFNIPFDFLLFMQEFSFTPYQISLPCYIFSPALLNFGQCSYDE